MRLMHSCLQHALYASDGSSVIIKRYCKAMLRRTDVLADVADVALGRSVLVIVVVAVAQFSHDVVAAAVVQHRRHHRARTCHQGRAASRRTRHVLRHHRHRRHLYNTVLNSLELALR